MKKLAILLTIWVLIAAPVAWGNITIGASLPDLASIAASVGGDRVNVFSVARGSADPHSVEVLPSYMVRVSRADLYLKVGLSLDQWADRIIEGARNSKLKIVDCSLGVIVREKPTGKVDASMGDVHSEGNPHYWLDPSNGILIAQTICEALISLDPTGEQVYKANLDRFTTLLEEKIKEWKTEAEALSNHSLITYHSSWAYFAAAFGLNIAAKIEPVPGIPPTASQLVKLVKVIKELQVKLVIQEPYFSDEGAKYLARETGIKVIKLAPSCDDASATSYLDHFQKILDALKSVN